MQAGVAKAVGDYVLVQDADLEYDPSDYVPMLRRLPAQVSPPSTACRTLGQLRARGWGHGLPGQAPGAERWSLAGERPAVVLDVRAFPARRVSDPLTGYKIYPTAVLRRFSVKTRGFETDHELTAKLIRAGVPYI